MQVYLYSNKKMHHLYTLRPTWGRRIYSLHGQALQLSVGIGMYLDIVLSAQARLDKLVDGKHSLEEQAAACQEVLDAPACDLTIFERLYRRRFRSVESMMSDFSRAFLKLRIRLKKTHTLTSELAHSRERKALAAANAPGRAFHHHARQDVLQQVRTRHLLANGEDPCAAKKTSAKKHTEFRAKPDLALCHVDPFSAVLPEISIQHAIVAATGQTFSTPQVACARRGHKLQLSASPLLQITDGGPGGAFAAGAALSPSESKQSGAGSSIKHQSWCRRARSFKRTNAAKRVMTMDEQAIIWDQVREDFKRMSPEEYAIAERAYAGTVKDRQRGLKRSAYGELAQPDSSPRPEKRYRPHFFINGTPELPIHPVALKLHHDMRGIPAESEVYKTSRFVIRQEDVPATLRGTPGFNCHRI